MKLNFVLACVPFFALTLNLSSVKAQQKNDRPLNNQLASPRLRSVITNDLGETNIEYVTDGHRHKIRLDGKKIVELYVDDKKVAEEDYAKYDSIVNKILVQIEKDRVQAEADRHQAMLDREQAEKDRKQADEDRKQAESDRKQADEDRKQADEDRKQVELNRKQVDESRKQAESHRRQVDENRKQAESDLRQADEDRRQAESDRRQAVKDRMQAEKDRKQAEKDRAQAEEDRKLMQEMMDELVKEKIVQNKDALKSIVLDETELIVNGTKQPDALHLKLKTKYLRNIHGRINYKNSDGSHRLSIDN